MRRGKALSLARAIKVESTKCNYVKPHFIGQAKERKQSATEVSSDEADSDEEGGVLTAEMLLMEDGEISFKRENLHQKKKRLMVAERELKTFTSKRNKERPT